jgi:LmbE family N-acetylglucosaminyl deacetylase
MGAAAADTIPGHDREHPGEEEGGVASGHLVILAVFAHPADVVAEAGGTLALHSDAGDRVVAVLLTHGGRIHPNIYVEEARKGTEGDERIAEASRERVIAIKRAEIESAAGILGFARVVCFDLEDNMVGASPEVISRT